MNISCEEAYRKCIEFNRKGREIIIYGAGLGAHLIYSNLMSKYGVKIDYFCTSYEPEHVDIDTKITVLNRESLYLHKEALLIIVLNITFSEKAFEECEKYALEAGFSSSNIITRTNDWIIMESKPYFNNQGKLNIYTLSYHVTKQCNLKCSMCAQLLFGLVKRRSFPSSQIIKDTNTLFRLINHIDILKLIGGELLTYARLDELIIHLNQYKDQIGLLEIYTNGAIIPSESILDAINSYQGNKQVTISDYAELSIAKDSWTSFGEKNSVKVNLLGLATKGKSGYKGWIDCREVKDFGESDTELQKKFIGCGQRMDFVLEDSIIGHCTSFHMLNYALDKDINKDGSVYLYDQISDEEKRKKIVNLGSDEKYLDVCRYCIWGSSIRDKLPRYPAAEQLERIPE